MPACSRTYTRSLAAIGGFGASALSPPAVEEPTSNGKNRGRNQRKRGRRVSETPSPPWFFAKQKNVTFSGPEEIDMDSASVLASLLDTLSPLRNRIEFVVHSAHWRAERRGCFERSCQKSCSINMQRRSRSPTIVSPVHIHTKTPCVLGRERARQHTDS